MPVARNNGCARSARLAVQTDAPRRGRNGRKRPATENRNAVEIGLGVGAVRGTDDERARQADGRRLRYERRQAIREGRAAPAAPARTSRPSAVVIVSGTNAAPSTRGRVRRGKRSARRTARRASVAPPPSAEPARPRWNDLPAEMLHSCFGWLDRGSDLSAAEATCAAWHRVASYPPLWHALCVKLQSADSTIVLPSQLPQWNRWRGLYLHRLQADVPTGTRFGRASFRMNYRGCSIFLAHEAAANFLWALAQLSTEERATADSVLQFYSQQITFHPRNDARSDRAYSWNVPVDFGREETLVFVRSKLLSLVDQRNVERAQEMEMQSLQRELGLRHVSVRSKSFDVTAEQQLTALRTLVAALCAQPSNPQPASPFAGLEFAVCANVPSSGEWYLGAACRFPIQIHWATNPEDVLRAVRGG